jgi:hypothetical protein
MLGFLAGLAAYKGQTLKEWQFGMGTLIGLLILFGVVGALARAL